MAENCANCGRKIGNLEIAHVHKQAIVCGECLEKLKQRGSPRRSASCANCGRSIGHLEARHFYADDVICPQCHDTLTYRRATVVAPQPTTIAIASNSEPRSFITAAVITFVLYFVGFWICGVVANFLYLGASKREMIRTRKVPEGRSFLQVILGLFFWGPVITIIIVLLAILAASEK